MMVGIVTMVVAVEWVSLLTTLQCYFDCLFVDSVLFLWEIFSLTSKSNFILIFFKLLLPLLHFFNLTYLCKKKKKKLLHY